MEKFLPVSVQDFSKMINGNFVYVDKTRYVYEMVRIPQAFYFLSRPRRFGKTLLVSTLKALFENKKELFKGLWIENSDWQWQPHPVVQIDFNGVKASDAEALEKSLMITLDEIAEQHDIVLKPDLLPNKFVKLFTELNRKYQQEIVVLIDEYDKPIITHLGQGEAGLQAAKQNRAILKEFFGVLKQAEVSAVLRFVFITGISKFSRVSIFSDLNNLKDLSMNEAYAGLLGYTRQELESYFSEWIDEFTRTRQTSRDEILQQLQYWYNGYRFTKKGAQVYNPFSILNALSEYDFKAFWFESGTPSLPVNLIKERDYSVPNIENLQIQEAVFSTYDLENLRLEALLFQTGYVTIQDYDGILFHLGYPNQEVKTAFLSFIYHDLVKIADATLQAQFSRLHQYLAQEDLAQFIETTNAILASIPYTQIRGQATSEGNEQYYHTVFYLMVAASGVLVQTEPLSSHGRMDIAVEFKDKVYVIELKCNQSADAAIQQIHAKRYHEKYLQSGRQIHLLGINFSTTERRIVDWRRETIGS